MSHTSLSKTKRKATAHDEALADERLAEMHHLNELMRQDREEIETLKADTARLTAENEIVLNRMKLNL